MADIFNISLLNPIRFIKSDQVFPSTYNYRAFDDDFFKNLILDRQTKAYYCQKYEQQDVTKIQILSDFPAITAQAINIDTGVTAATYPVSEVVTSLEGVTYKVYEFQINFTTLPADNEYVIRVTYLDGANVVEYLSEPIDVAVSHPGTILMQYKNFENNFSVVFDTGIEFSFRVEALLDSFNPGSDDTIYIDQKHNSSLLNSIPFREFRFNAGGGNGVPDWVIDKMNRVFSCDSVKLDGYFYTKTDGAKWEVTRDPDYPLAGASLSIQPVDNADMLRLKVKGLDTGTANMIQRVQKYLNAAADIEAAGIFHENYILEKICIYKSSSNDITLKVGTSDGGTQITEFLVEEFATTIVVNWLFETDNTVYLDGLTAAGDANCNIFLVYKYLLDDTASGGGGGTGGFVKNTVYMYSETTAGDFDLDFDQATGLGRVGRAYEGCAMMDGRNGTPNMGGRTVFGFDPLNPDYNAFHETGGSATVSLTGDQNGPHDHNMSSTSPGEFGLIRRSVSGENKTAGTIDSIGSGTEPDVLTTPAGLPNSGLGAPHENRPPYLVMVYFKKITD